MAFEDVDQSRQDSQPIELATLTLGGVVYRYTSSDVDYVHVAGTYLSVPMMRTSQILHPVGEAREIVLELPDDSDAMIQNIYGVLPTQMHVKIERVQLGAVGDTTRTVWEGDIDGINVEGRVAKLRIPSMMDAAVAIPVPAIFHQPQCNFALYDPNTCKVSTAAFAVDTTISTVATKSVTVGSVGGHPDGYFRAGVIIRVSDGEKRTITSHEGTTLGILNPFRVLVATDAVQILAGCDYTIQTCHERFDNRLNFGGHPYVPSDFVVANRLITRRK